MTTALSLLVLLGFGVPGPATALQFDTFSLSAVITPVPFFGVTSASITATAYPNVQLGVHFSGQPGQFPIPFNFVSMLCQGPSIPGFPPQYDPPCRPGDTVGTAALSLSFFDTHGSLSLPGSSIDQCDAGGFPPLSPAGGRISDRCANFSGQISFAGIVLPPFMGTTEISVETVFSASAGATILQYAPGSLTPSREFISFSGTGRGEFDLLWQPNENHPPGWLPLRAEGFIAATPEPATLLLWGTSAAGLGLARWRRRGRAHAA
jgi:hypothetical protein